MHSRTSRTLALFAFATSSLLTAGTLGCSSSSTSSGTPVDGGTVTDAPSGTDAPAPANDAGVTAAQACADSAHAVCTERSTCSMGFNISKNFADEMTCETRTALSCVANLGGTGTGQSPANLEACAAVYSTEACGAYFDNNPIAACVPPAGTGATGAACSASAQCASTFCAIPQYQVCGTCQALPVAGATCQVTADCGRNLACAVPTGATSGTCAAYATLNGMCLTGTQPCAEGLACVNEDVATGTMGTCQTAGATVGATCDPTRKAQANCVADLGLVCIPGQAGTTTSCQSISLVGPSAPCGDIGTPSITGFADCEAGGLCVKPLTDAGTAATMGTCVAPAADGAACDNDPTKGPPCLGPAKCVPAAAGGTAGTCTLPDPTKCM